MLAIKPFAGTDTEKIINLILSIQTTEFGVAITREDQPDLEIISEFYQQGNGNFWIASYNQEIVGTIALLDIGNNQSALRKMFVHPDFRGKTHLVAQKLLDILISHAKNSQINDIYLGTTAKYLAAHRFYEKNGFRTIDKRSLPETFPLVHVDTIFYKLKLS